MYNSNLSTEKNKEFKLAVFISGSGSNLQSIIDSGFDVRLVVSNKSNAYGLERAKKHNIETMVLSKYQDQSKGVDYTPFLNYLKDNQIDLIILAGYLQKIPLELIELFKDRILNIHPSLLPKYGGKGFYGSNVHRAVFESGDKFSGATIHLVNDEYDRGRILMQREIDISTAKDYEEIAVMVLKVEHELYPEAIKKYMEEL